MDAGLARWRSWAWFLSVLLCCSISVCSVKVVDILNENESKDSGGRYQEKWKQKNAEITYVFDTQWMAVSDLKLETLLIQADMKSKRQQQQQEQQNEHLGETEPVSQEVYKTILQTDSSERFQQAWANEIVSIHDLESKSKGTIMAAAEVGDSEPGKPRTIESAGEDKLEPRAPSEEYEYLIETQNMVQNTPQYTMASIDSLSMFVLLPAQKTEKRTEKENKNEEEGKKRNTVVELFNNGENWVFVRHHLGNDVDVHSIFTFNGQLFATTKNGHLWERRKRVEFNDLEWVVTKDQDIQGAARLSGRRKAESVYFLNSAGQVLERIPQKDNRTDWHLYENEYQVGDLVFEKPVCIADAESLEPHLVFLVGENGNLLEGTLNRRNKVLHLQNLGHPSVLPFSPTQAVALKKNSYTRTKSLFLATLPGDLVELVMHPKNGYEWILHGRPSPEARILITPGPNLHPRSIFMLTCEGKVMERHLLGTEWIWIEHANPTIPSKNDDHEEGEEQEVKLQQVVGQPLNSFTIYFLTSTNQFAVRVWSGNGWKWTIEDLPEVGNAPYCIGDPNSPNSCTSLVKKNSDNENN